MTRYVLLAGLVVGLLAGVLVWYQMQISAAERAGREKQIALNVAKANQEIAARRQTDAKFDSMDARQHCVGAGLEWVFVDGKSFCR